MSIQGMYQSGLTKQIMDQRMTRHAAENQDLADENDALIARNQALSAQNQAQAARIRQLETLLAQHQTLLVEAKLEKAGFKAQALALRSSLVAANAKDALLQKTGKVYSDGAHQTVLGSVFDAAVDAEAVAMKLPNAGKAYRMFAK